MTVALLVRLVIIAETASPAFIDLQIYRSAGALTLAGINPFDSAHLLASSIAEAIRVDPRYFDVYASDPANWGSYVSSNPPLSVLYWAALEAVSPVGSGVYLVVFSVTDVVLYALAVLLHRRLTGCLRVRELIGLALLTVLNPLLLWWGTVLPEDKQFQTCLVLGLLLLMRTSHFFGTGFIAGCVLLFKAVGFPLTLVAAYEVFRQRQARRSVAFVLGGLIPLAMSALAFGSMFIEPMFSRLLSNSNPESVPIHDSLWRVFPATAGFRVAAFVLFVAIGVLWAFVSIRHDWRLAYVALWTSLGFVMVMVTSGSWDRQLMGLLPVYIATFSLIRRARWWMVAQCVLTSWLYVILVGPDTFGWFDLDIPSQLAMKAGPMASLLSIVLLVLTAVILILIDSGFRTRLQLVRSERGFRNGVSPNRQQD